MAKLYAYDAYMESGEPLEIIKTSKKLELGCTIKYLNRFYLEVCWVDNENYVVHFEELNKQPDTVIDCI